MDAMYTINVLPLAGIVKPARGRFDPVQFRSMPNLEIPYSEDLASALDLPPGQVEDELRFWLAVKLFELGRLSLGKAAELAGMKKIHFMDELGRRKIPITNLDDEQFARELSGAVSTGSTPWF